MFDHPGDGNGGNPPKKLIAYLLPSLQGQWGRVAFACGCLLSSIVLRIIEPWPLQYVIDEILFPIAQSESSGRTSAAAADLDVENGGWGDSSWTAASLCALAFIAISGIRAVAEYWKSVSFSLTGNHVVSDLRAQVFDHLQVLPISFHGKSRNGDITLRLVSDMNMLKEVAVNAALPLISSVLVLIGMFGYMLYLNWRLGLMVLAVIPICGLITARRTREIHQASQRQRQHESHLASTASESMSAVKTVQALGVSGGFARAFRSQNRKSLSDGVKTGRLTAGLERSVDFMIAIASAVVLWQGTRFVLEGSLTAGGLIVYLAYLKRGFRPLQGFAKYVGRISKASAAGERITEILNTPAGIVDLPGAISAPKLRGALRFEDVSYRYEANIDVLKNFSFQVEAGECVAIVGPSGIGKSTLLSLVIRLDDPQGGAIRIDGVDIRDWKVQSLREQISIVLQDNTLFCGTIEENIRLCSPCATFEDVLRAVRLANCQDFLERLPDGLKTLVGEKGCNLSRGQQQRLALAQAVLRNSPIMLLDEPTSNLDPENRACVRDAILQVARDRTTLIVTHDMELAHACDKVLLLAGSSEVLYGEPKSVLQHNAGVDPLAGKHVTAGGR